MKLFPLVILLTSLLLPIHAEEPRATGISPELLGELERSLTMDDRAHLARNVLAQFDQSKVNIDWDKVIAIDRHFSHKLPAGKITNQESTGRCWMFAGLNVLRPAAAKALGVEDIEFSQSYLFFYDKLEKANMFLEGVMRSREKPLDDRLVEFLLRTPVPDGGQWCGLVELTRKYGVVPKEIMPETYSSSHSAGMNRALGLKLRQYAQEIRRLGDPARFPDLKKRALKDVYHILAVNFGRPPKTFSWRAQGKDKKLTAARTFTPQQFFHEAIGENLDDYYALFAIPGRPEGKLYEIDFDKAVYDRPNLTFVNVSVEKLKELAKASILDGRAVWFGCDVGKDTFGDKGLMVPEIHDLKSLYGMDFKLSRRDLVDTYHDSPNHAMVFSGLDLQGGRVTKWLVENSWSEKAGNDGYFTMLDEWFSDYVLMVVVHKKYLPAQVLDLFQTRAEVLPPWDPMYRALTVH